MRADEVADLSRSEWTRVIDEHIHDELWRRIFKRRWLDGVKLEPLAEEFDLSLRQVQRIVRTCERRIINHM